MKEDARNMNDQPDRFELFTLEEGEEKVTMEYDSRLPNTAIFTFAREDHTLGNLLASALLSTDHVHFAAYKVPHPLFPTFILRVSTNDATGPREALEVACKRVIHDLQNMAKQFTREWEIWKLTNEAAAGREDGEKVEREKRMAEARKVRDRIREEMLREGEEMMWSGGGGGGSGGGAAVGNAPWDDGDDGDGYVSPQWDRGNGEGSENTSGRAPCDEPTGPTTRRAPWEEPTEPATRRAPWEEPAETTTRRAFWDEPTEPTTRRASWEELTEPTTRRAPWDEPATITGNSTTRAPWEEPTEPNTRRAPWDEPSPTTPTIDNRVPLDEPTNSRSAPLNNPLFDSGEKSSRDLLISGGHATPPWGQPTASIGGRAPWGEPDTFYNSGQRSLAPEPPSSGRVQPYQQPSPQSARVRGGEPASGSASYNSGGRTLTREQRSAPPNASAPWNQPGGSDRISRVPWNESTDPNAPLDAYDTATPPRGLDPAGEQAYLSRPSAMITSVRASDEPAGGSAAPSSSSRDYQGQRVAGVIPWDIAAERGVGRREPWEQEERCGDGGGSKKELLDSGYGGKSSQWDGGYGGDTPTPAPGETRAPWDDY